MPQKNIINKLHLEGDRADYYPEKTLSIPAVDNVFYGNNLIYNLFTYVLFNVLYRMSYPYCHYNLNQKY